MKIEVEVPDDIQLCSVSREGAWKGEAHAVWRVGVKLLQSDPWESFCFCSAADPDLQVAATRAVEALRADIAAIQRLMENRSAAPALDLSFPIDLSGISL